MTDGERGWLGAGTMFAAASGFGLAGYSTLVARRAESLVPRDGRVIEVEGARLHVVDQGSGPAIVMVHGLAGQLRNFSYAMLEPLAARHRVVLIDRPGSGYSVATGRYPGIAEQAAMVARAIRALEVERPLLVGHSLGGAVCLALALDHPGLVRGLALIAPLTQPQDTIPDMFRTMAMMPAGARTLMAQLFGTPMAQVTAAETAAQVFAPEPVPADFATRGGGALAVRPRTIAAASADLGAARDEMAGLAARYGELSVPVDMLFGRGDRVLAPALHGERTAAAISGARLEMVEGGHMLPVTRPGETVRFVEGMAGRA